MAPLFGPIWAYAKSNFGRYPSHPGKNQQAISEIVQKYTASFNLINPNFFITSRLTSIDLQKFQANSTHAKLLEQKYLFYKITVQISFKTKKIRQLK